MASLDTNCLVRWLLDDVPDQRRRVEALLADAAPLTVDDAALIETVFVLESSARLDRPTIEGLLLAAMSQPLVLDRELWTAVLGVWRDHPKLSVVDIYLAHKAHAHGDSPLYTFDVKLAHQVAGVARVPESPPTRPVGEVG